MSAAHGGTVAVTEGMDTAGLGLLMSADNDKGPVLPGQHETACVQRNATIGQPVAGRIGTREQENVAEGAWSSPAGPVQQTVSRSASPSSAVIWVSVKRVILGRAPMR